MIRELCDRLAAEFGAAACPFLVVDGPEPTDTTTGARERVVLSYDDGDSFVEAFSQRDSSKSKHVATCRVGAKATIYAQSGKAGAMPFEHRRRARRTLEVLISSLDRIFRGALKVQWALGSGGFIEPQDSAGSPRIAGAVYELKFTFDSAIRGVAWSGDAPVTATLNEIASTSEIRLANGPADAEPETCCGA